MNNKLTSILIKIVIPIIGIGATIWGVFDSFNEREFSYEEILVTEFGESKSNGWPEIKFSFKDKEISNGGIVSIKFKNTGNEPIYAKEFDQPIIVLLDEKSNFLSVKLVSSTPKNLSPPYAFEGNKLSIDPALFNSDDEITLQAVVNGNPSINEVLTRIGGINNIILIQPTEKRFLKFLSWPLLVYGFIAFMWIGVLTSAISTVIIKQDVFSVEITKTSGIIISALILMPASFSIGRFLEYQNIYPESWWSYLIIIMVLIVVADLLSTPFKIKKSNK